MRIASGHTRIHDHVVYGRGCHILLHRVRRRLTFVLPPGSYQVKFINYTSSVSQKKNPRRTNVVLTNVGSDERCTQAFITQIARWPVLQIVLYVLGLVPLGQAQKTHRVAKNSNLRIPAGSSEGFISSSTHSLKDALHESDCLPASPPTQPEFAV